MNEKANIQAIELAAKLRNKGVYAYFEIEKTSMKAQMKSADRLKADSVIFIGEDEINTNTLTLKNMITGEQLKIDESDLLK